MKSVMWLITSLLILLFSAESGAETWSNIESQHFVVMFTEDEGKAREIRDIAEDFYPKVTGDLGYSPGRKITIWLFESKKDFKQAAEAPIQDWAAGYAYPLQARVVVRDPPAGNDRKINRSRLIKHEITHVIFGLYLGQNLKNVPRWLNEGIAMYAAEEWSYSHYWTMLIGVLGNSLIPLYDLSDDFPQIESQARMAYTQSCSIVTFMIDKYGIESLRKCISLLSKGQGMDEALANTMGIDSYWMERKWLRDLRKKYKWLSLAGNWITLWGFVTLMVLVAYFWIKLRNRRILKQWKEEEEELWSESDEFQQDEEDESEF